MKDEKDVIELLRDFPETQDLNPGLTKEAKLLAQELYCNKKKQGKGIWWKILTAVFVPVCLAVAVVTPILLKKAPAPSTPSRYFNNQDITWEETNISECLKANPIKIWYFSLENAQCQEKKYTIKATNELAYFQQDILLMGADYFDLITLFIVPSEDKFEKFDEFVELNSLYKYGELPVNYNTTEVQNKYTTMAKFTHESVHYYMTVQSGDETRWQTYIAELFG